MGLDLDQLKIALGLDPVAQRMGVELHLKRNVRCPFHEDRTPSFGPYTAKDGTPRFKCQGCKWEGDVFDFVAKSDGIEVPAAIKLLSNGKSNGAAPAKMKAPPPPKRLEITEAEVTRMQEALEGNPRAQEYLSVRGISMEAARRNRFGFTGRFFKDLEPEPGELPALAMPDFRDGKLVGVKYRSIEGRHFTHASGSTNDGLFSCDGLDLNATEVLVVEGPLDVVLLRSHGRNATGPHSASSKLGAADHTALKRYKKIYLIGDMDEAGQEFIKALEKELPPEQVSRVRLRGVKDVGDLYAKEPAAFAEKLNAALRIADISRENFTWDDLETDAELEAGGTGVLPYLVQGLLPLDDLTMFAGREGSCKTLLALYIGKCVANAAPVFGNFETVKKPVLYLDAENQDGTHKVYIPIFRGVGPEQVRWRTLRYGVPPLTSPALLRIVEEKRPLLIVDSLIRFCGTRDRDSSEMTVVMEQLSRLVTAGATVLLIHHTKKSAEDEYANSFVIGATAAFIYAITTEDTFGFKRVKMIHKKARGGGQNDRHLNAFPSILDLGMFTLDGDPPKSDKEKVIDFVKARGGCQYTTIKAEVHGLGPSRIKKAIEEAVEAGELAQTGEGRKVFYSALK